ncbi:MAG TPA: DUF2076 domain-containing protein [Xanthobacteraceae bacterium]|nr:DUF2076 domain-containing protein [Xanthobacteraceae bacterium]
MDTQDRQAIERLFTRLSAVEQQAGPRDAAAEAFIRERIARQPDAPYFMAQTVVMQDYALQAAQSRIEELEQKAAQRPAGGGGLLGGLFGGANSGRSSVPPIGRRSEAPPTAPTSPVPPMAQPGRGGGFLAGAAQTAMGVAGGVLLGNAIAGMFGGSEAQAAESAPAETAPAEDASAADEGGGFFDSFFGGGEEG